MKTIRLSSTITESDISIEDCGKAIIVDPMWKPIDNCDEHFFVRLQSYDESIKSKSKVDSSHNTIRSLYGKKITVTITIED
jgi:hypothetical protein